MSRQRQFDFMDGPRSISADEFRAPTGYTGLYRFHKYWGKKPSEPIAYAIEKLTRVGQCILDPFVGSGTTAREALLRSRRFIGFDINPVAVDLARLLITPPSYAGLKTALVSIKKDVHDKIQTSYVLQDEQSFASHYLWDHDNLREVWVAGRGSGRITLKPTPHDLVLSASFASYRSRRLREPRFFTNSRINADPAMRLNDVLTGRAQRNIDLILEAIDRCDSEFRRPLTLCLTAASGQMTNMVFAVTGRGKTKGVGSPKIEVGSWVVGYWRPRLHFEVNVWNCFEIRANALLKALRSGDQLESEVVATSVDQVLDGCANVFLKCDDCIQALKRIPPGAIDLVITDPPHGDRIPYLELSEFWNSIHGFCPDLTREIVVSNAKERGKTAESYIASMQDVMHELARVISPTGLIVLLFNGRLPSHWQAFQRTFQGNPGSELLQYLGCFPCFYSATSVVQDNRQGALTTDIALVFAQAQPVSHSDPRLRLLSEIPNWSTNLPHNFGGQ